MKGDIIIVRTEVVRACHDGIEPLLVTPGQAFVVYFGPLEFSDCPQAGVWTVTGHLFG